MLRVEVVVVDKGVPGYTNSSCYVSFTNGTSSSTFSGDTTKTFDFHVEQGTVVTVNYVHAQVTISILGTLTEKESTDNYVII